MAWNSAIVHLAIELSIVCCGVTQDYNSSNCAEFRVTHLLPGTPLTVTELSTRRYTKALIRHISAVLHHQAISVPHNQIKMNSDRQT